MQDGAFAAALRSDGYNEVVTKVAPHAPPTPEHTHPFDVRALVLEGAITLTAEGLGRASFRHGPWPAACRGHRPRGRALCRGPAHAPGVRRAGGEPGRADACS